MPPIFSEYKKLIDTFLLQFLDSKKEELALVNSFGANLCDRIGKMSVSGKSIRGSLALLAYCFTNAKPSENAIKIAAALELLQTALVTHDYIMDRDAVRRGIPSFYVQYKSDGMAMCVGDLLFFLAMELLGSIKTDEVTLGRIVRFTGREYGLVCLAQMGDVAHTAKSKD